MSSTTVFKGSFGEKPSSRVLQPPGGGSSNIFGPVDEPPRPVKAAEPPKATEQPKAADPPKATEQPKATPQTADAVKEESPSVAAPEAKESAKEASRTAKEQQQAPQPPQAAVSSRFRNSGFNPITGEPYPDAKVKPTAEDKKTTSIIVKQPPGGASSGLW